MPRNNIRPKTAEELDAMTAKARKKWQAKWNAREQEIQALKKERDSVIEDDGFWCLSSTTQTILQKRLNDLICPPNFFPKIKSVFEFAGIFIS